MPATDINRAALLRMDTGKPIAVVGHKSQDPDAVCSAIAMADLLRQLGMDATAYIQEKPIQGVKYVLDYVGYAVPELKTSIEPGMPMVLVDHNDYMQSMTGVEHANVVGVVDHHAISSSLTSNIPIFCDIMDVGSANTIVFSIYRGCGLLPGRDVARIMVAGILADTDSLQKATCTQADKLALDNLKELAGYTDLTEMTQGIKAALNSFDGMTAEEIFMSDIKSYEIAGVKLAVTSLDANESLPMDQMCESMRAVMPAILQKLNVQMLFAKMEDKTDVLDADGNPTVIYTTHIPYYGEGAKDVAESAFGPTVHDNCIVVNRKVSRKTDFIPAITRVLESFAKDAARVR